MVFIYVAFIALGIAWGAHLYRREERARRRRRYPPYRQRWTLDDE